MHRESQRRRSHAAKVGAAAATCSLTVPSTAKGKTIVVKLTVSYGGADDDEDADVQVGVAPRALDEVDRAADDSSTVGSAIP